MCDLWSCMSNRANFLGVSEAYEKGVTHKVDGKESKFDHGGEVKYSCLHCLCFSTAEPVANQMESFSEIARCGCGLNVSPYSKTRWTCLHVLGDDRDRSGSYSSCVTKTAGLWILECWDQQCSEEFFGYSLGQEVQLKNQKKALHYARSNLCILTLKLISYHALTRWSLWYTWRQALVSEASLCVCALQSHWKAVLVVSLFS